MTATDVGTRQVVPDADLRPAADLRAAFRRYPTGVAIVAAWGPDGPVGLTISSLASVSADPPVLSFSLSAGTRSAALLLDAESLAVHVLPRGRATLADGFARHGEPRFTPEQGWELPVGEPPRLPDAVASLGGRVRATVPVEDSVLVLLDVTSTSFGSVREPLLHLDRRYRHVGTRARQER